MTRQLLWWERVDAFVGWLYVGKVRSVAKVVTHF